MKRMIKICGLTRPADARLCAREGADRLGLIFAPSPRQVTPAEAAAIAAAVPGVPLTGVFVGVDTPLVVAAVEAAGLTHVQVHRESDPDRLAALAAACGRPVIPALAFDQLADAEHLTAGPLLLDLSKDPARRTPEHLARLHRAAADLTARGHEVILAGALTCETVTAALDLTRCAGVDVCGGVEQAPGIKDPDRVRRFIAAVRHLEATHVD